MDLACYYVLDGNTFKEIKREVGCSFCGAAYFYCHSLSANRYSLSNRRYIWSCGRYNLKIADIFGVVVDIFEKSPIKISFTNEHYTLILLTLQNCKVNVMLTNSSSSPKGAK